MDATLTPDQLRNGSRGVDCTGDRELSTAAEDGSGRAVKNVVSPPEPVEATLACGGLLNTHEHTHTHKKRE